jgi:hypothetical protein
MHPDLIEPGEAVKEIAMSCEELYTRLSWLHSAASQVLNLAMYVVPEEIRAIPLYADDLIRLRSELSTTDAEAVMKDIDDYLAGFVHIHKPRLDVLEGRISDVWPLGSGIPLNPSKELHFLEDLLGGFAVSQRAFQEAITNLEHALLPVNALVSYYSATKYTLVVRDMIV